MQGGVRQRPHAQRHVGAVFHQIHDTVVAGELQRDLGILAPEIRDVRHHAMQHHRHRRIHPQAAGRTLMNHAHAFFGLFQRRHDLPGL
ncbi:hypothetical protein D3C72_2170520 [compost metagenome]